MPSVRLDQFLASTAVVLLLSTGIGGASAEPMTEAQIQAAIPVPEPANVPPPTAADINTSAVQPTESDAAPQAPAAAAAPETTGTTGTPPIQTAKPAPSPAAAPAPAQITPAPSALAAADAAIAEQLRGMGTGKFDRIIGKKDRVTIDAFYSGRDYAPMWITDGKPNPRAKAAIAYLGHVDADGLDPAEYAVPEFAALSDPGALAEAELKMTAAILLYAHHAQIGRVHWSRVSGDIFYTEAAPEPADVLANMVEAKDVAAALDAYEPQTPGYLALKHKLAEMRGGKEDTGGIRIPSGRVLKVGMQDARVPQLRERLGVPGDEENYDKALADAVKKFQQQQRITPTGALTAATVDALNGGRRPDHQTDIILANMERWRWMPHDLGSTYVIVNIPDYTLRVFHNGKQAWVTKVVVGKPTMPTPIMQAEMKYITVNPTWNVPPSIVNHEYLPALQQDPTVLERMGLKVSHNPDGSIHIYQPPGDRNALGRLRFNFPNKFLVYQHDTPDKYMFNFDKRAFSHGCMRVLDPPKYAEVLLSIVRPNDGYTAERIRRMFGSAETDIQFPTFMPVNLTYQTAFVDDDGKLQFREDIYGRDAKLISLLKGEERKVADIPIERKENPKGRAIAALPDQPFLWGGNGRGGDGGGFFARLFGGGPAANPGPSKRRHVSQRPAPDFH